MRKIRAIPHRYMRVVRKMFQSTKHQSMMMLRNVHHRYECGEKDHTNQWAVRKVNPPLRWLGGEDSPSPGICNVVVKEVHQRCPPSNVMVASKMG